MQYAEREYIGSILDLPHFTCRYQIKARVHGNSKVTWAITSRTARTRRAADTTTYTSLVQSVVTSAARGVCVHVCYTARVNTD